MQLGLHLLAKQGAFLGRTIMVSAALALSIPASMATGQTRDVALTLHSRGAASGMTWPVTFGVPFPEGALTDPALLRLIGPDGQSLPIQVRTTATWFDDSIQWVLIDTQTSLPSEKATYKLTWDAEGAIPAAAAQATWQETAERVLVDTGEVRFEVSKKRMVPFEEISFKNAQGQWVSAFPEEKFSELYLEDGEGNSYRCSMAGEPDVVVEEKGPQRASIKIEGWMQSEDGRQLGRRIVRIYAFAGMKSLRVYDTFVNTADTDKVKFANISLHLPFQGDRYRFHDAGMDQAQPVKESAYLLQHEYNAFDVVADGKANSQSGRAPGRVTVSEGDSAYTVAWRHFWQLYPNEIEVTPGDLRLHFWPRHGKPARYRHDANLVTVENIPQVRWVHEGKVLDFTPPDDVVNFEYPDYRHDNISNIVGTNAMGIARTSEYWLDFHGQGEQGVAERIGAFEAQPLVLADPKWMAESKAFWDCAEFNEQYADVELPIAKMLDFYLAMVESLGDYGKWIYGGYHQDYMPGFKYAWIHRTWPGFHHGMPRWPWLTLVRTGDPHYFDFAELVSRNLTDVSIVHWEDQQFNAEHFPKPAPPYRCTGKNLGAQTRYKGIVPWHEGQEVSYNAQVDFALWYFYLTGYQHAYDTAMWQGEMLLREESLLRLEKGLPDAGYPPDNLFPTQELRDAYFAGEHKGSMHNLLTPGRQGTAPAAAALDLYRATHDERYLMLAKRVVDFGMKLEDERPGDGFANQFYAPMLIRYWEVTRDESIKPYVVQWARDRMRNKDARNWNGRDQYYDQMALAYGFTGDVEFLKHGLAQSWIVKDNRFAPNMGDYAGVAYWYGGPSGVGYAGQEWGYFQRALENHYKRTGERLLPPGPTEAYPFTTLVSSTEADGEHRIVFHLKKEGGEPVEVDFRFNSRSDEPVDWQLTDADGWEIRRGSVQSIPVKGRAHPTSSEGAAPARIGADLPDGEYRLVMRSAARMDVHWPYRSQGRFGKLVVEMPVSMSMRMGPALRVFMPASDKLTVSIPEHDYRSFGTYRIYDAEGAEVFAFTGAGRTNTPASFKIAIPVEQRGRPWFYRRSESQGTTPEPEMLEMYPVWAAEKEAFFVPRFLLNREGRQGNGQLNREGREGREERQEKLKANERNDDGNETE